MNSSESISSLSEPLTVLSEKKWQHFTEQHPNFAEQLSENQLCQFKKAITLSDFVFKSAQQAPDLVLALYNTQLFDNKDNFTMPNYQVLLSELLSDCQDEVQLHRLLRRFRLQHMVLIAMADMVLDIELDTSLACLSSLADELILASLHWLTTFCQSKWGTPVNAQGEEQVLLVYGMGKLGGKELNFSSDIDLIFTYPESGETINCRRTLDNQQFFTRLAQKLISSLHQVTADGFVYRVDMRLRPFGESGPLVLTFNAMEDYYQEQGRDWERYAMLKARLIGKSPYHDTLSTMLRPFVYRRYIDFSVIDSLRRMKMMISQEVRRKQLVNNIKLGAGGIREIEFIVQVFQLIRGGRDKSLQQRRLLTVLPLLVEVGEISASSRDVLEKAYRFLRRVENIIQALDDKQTQTLPDDEINQQRILSVLNIASWTDFLSVLQGHMDAVHQEFDLLIGIESPNHQVLDEHWTTLWLSRWSDEESVAWLDQEKKPWSSEKVWSLLSDFRQETEKRSLGNRGRQVLEKLIPLLICHIQDKAQAEVMLERVLHVFTKIVTRTAYLELLFENEGALKQLIHLCQASSWVTDYIAKYPILLDELIDPKLLHNPPQLSAYALELRERMLRIPEDDLEAQMEALRQFKQSQQLRIAAADIANVLLVNQVSQHLTALAEAIVDEVISIAWQQVAQRFGVPSSCADDQNIAHKNHFGVIAYGKTGGSELGYSSDLDLVFVHQSERDEMTTGDKSVSASQFYMKLAQRIMHIFNTRMSSGILYELDMRLRPSGNSGVLVVHLNTFAQYQHEDAWTWEHQALVRARMIYGSETTRDKFAEIRKEVLSLARDTEKLNHDVKEMREKMRTHLDKSTQDLVDIKQGVGGLVDIEFLAQYLVLAHCHQHLALCQHADNIGIYKQLAKEAILSAQESSVLNETYQELRALGHQASMQNAEQSISQVDFENQQVIASLWQKYLP
ncbi:bifunctional [glutamate--ammonia ligase]-adenylyl-L-tyrosine phosphorylase/[glutamate--ammonia-ligase] adenylyltransferase [Colwellia sp. RSH04]|uniref:bifunctional [glutamate--ammonia ligase]-adenylyl-L-tyrosine phosphorylase/[glutamate--ammonia-ligase] adenylyltransferase n=1 Tax=Colwellia sp. RSH04 TaxID=2305464 RepID=UPI000E581EDD|nr:bifunctional [glutamate--ammonia ligase]-adenylyl-L-tyrosine phosphorylase/[glutamate--ammonia-ligase] adenylyltransferase [Colwellia sp. RSH04]RHW77656.1 bifunctional [glutamate--ammonia ligase]-adenylyl-L-tyrosine phosphorylase/[glutamate--ammonia-ligase] adenylyltransferase [Colwellia sp. RSH04]